MLKIYLKVGSAEGSLRLSRLLRNTNQPLSIYYLTISFQHLWQEPKIRIGPGLWIKVVFFHSNPSCLLQQAQSVGAMVVRNKKKKYLRVKWSEKVVIAISSLA